jgi:putative flippase GtrA
MKSKLKALKDKYFDWSMIRWMLVGLLTTTIDYLIFISLYGPINSVVVANFISGFVSTSINYYTHHRWTFKSDQEHSKSGTKYLVNLIFWWVVSTFIIKILIFLNIEPRIAKLIPIFFIAPLNYILLNYVIFQKSK